MMHIKVRDLSENNPTPIQLTVAIKSVTEGEFTARILEWADCHASGSTKEEALERLQGEIRDRLDNSEMYSLEIMPANGEHPWMKFAGMYADNPLFDEVLEEIAAYRNEIDAEMEEEFENLQMEEV
ncbi:type II toxin-antitoxin system HicB family antitoxin [Phormidium sp. CCY1219]|uniref:type II toxin-antitoxin system HicB family antitoxin n=1 Tax=Phormidium sp. CCY1219 TaxID=2886104 RepID=UPI002D1EB46C|nr:type II toxin-antitoxin system HicB family antitoxin [Phormidium sp. CCY1219]MEB3830778.1 type II toxin-antitoxin system HicB family antitoxin [Phormidium sp. CCY1219]